MQYDDISHRVQVRSTSIDDTKDNDLDPVVNAIFEDSCSDLELSIQCQSLAQMDATSNSDPFVVVYMAENGRWKELGRTEVLIDDPNPKFTTSFAVSYYFEEVQAMRFVVYDANDFHVPPEKIRIEEQDMIGYIDLSLKDIHCAKKQEYHKLVNNNDKNKDWGKILIHSEEISQKNDKIVLELGCKNIPNGDIFLIINRKGENNISDACYRSEVKNNKSGEIIFDRIEILSQKLCNGDYYRPLIFEIYLWGKNGQHLLLCNCQSNINGFQRKKEMDLKMRGEKIGKLSIMKCEIIKQPTFLSYIKGGCELNFMVAIDFTGSNGDPSERDSLHYINGSSDNEYESAIKMVGNVLEHYDSDKLFPSYGFGCFYEGEIRHCFPINGDECNPEVYGMSGIINSYHKIMKSIRFCGPTLFSEILQTAASVAESYEDLLPEQKYLILLIITDGVIDDMDETIELLVQCSKLPLSVLIVGVGDADFSNMRILDGDEVRLEYDGVKAERDIVQFVAARHLKDERQTAKELLAEIPRQLCDYMKSKGLEPNQMRVKSVKQSNNIPYPLEESKLSKPPKCKLNPEDE